MGITIGADPELFLTNGGRLISAIDRIGGSKQEPLDIGEGCAIQEDNVAAEFCIPPAEKVEDFIKSIQYATNYIRAIARDYQLDLAIGIASYSFDKDQLAHPKAQEFGCDPDYNAWTLEMNPRPQATDACLRSAGGHVHIGTKKDIIEVVKCADLYLGVPSTLKDSDTKRRQLYGNAGCFRPKPYGVEYRTLSNFWIWSVRNIEWVFKQTVKAEEMAETISFSKEDEEMIRTCISKGDTKLAYDISKKFKLGLRNV